MGSVNYATLDDIDPNWRARWRLGTPLGQPGGMIVPVDRVFVHHTVSPDTGNLVADVTGPCVTDQQNFGKLSYSYNIHGSTRTIVEIEGTHRGAHTINNAQQSLNGVSFGFGVIGNFHSAQPVPAPMPVTDELVELVATAIVEKVVKPGLAVAGFRILGHRDAPYATACCGDRLYARLPDIRDAVADLSKPHPLPPHEEDDMNPTIVHDGSGREWVIVVGDDRRAYAIVDQGKEFRIGRPDHPEDAGVWTSGLAATFLPDGHIRIVGRGSDRAPWTLTFDPTAADQQPAFKKLPGFIYPAA